MKPQKKIECLEESLKKLAECLKSPVTCLCYSMPHAVDLTAVVDFLYIIKLIVNKTGVKQSKREIRNYTHRNHSAACYLTYQSKITWITVAEIR